MDDCIAIIMLVVIGVSLIGVSHSIDNINLSLKKIINIEKTINKVKIDKD